jgi:glyoxylase-like metal-dependent hydrolase (beta-lactamase superfamily II)
MFEPGVLRARWTPGSPDCAGTPPFFVHEYNSTFLILRQSGCTNFEKPFLYLLLGANEAMLVDTGAEGADVSAAVGSLLRGLPLLVVHSHGHDDHVAGDAAFRGREGVRLVEPTRSAVAAFFGLPDWPRGVAQYDLGERVLDVFPIPGHEPASIAIYDRRTGILLAGDVLYPGRLYVRDDAAFRASIDRLVAFTSAHDVTHILGCHIENTRTPYVDYPEGTTFQPDEHALELGRAHLLELQIALREMDGPIVRRRLRDFTIWPVAAE